MSTRILVTAIVSCAALLLAQQTTPPKFQGIRHVAEIGHLQPNSRLALNPRSTTASATTDGDVVISGRDDSGNRWNAWLNIRGGIGGTDVWTGDFDHNGRDDLLIASFFPANGRCLDPETVTFLMIDSTGKPVPWRIGNQIPRLADSPVIPPLLIDAGSGRAEIVATDCEYGNPEKLGEDRSVTGVYIAENAHWRMEKSTSQTVSEQLSRLVRNSYRFRDGADKWLPIEPATWSDVGNAATEPVLAGTTIISTQVPDEACRVPVRLNVENGRVTLPSRPDPCEEAGKFRFTLSSGQRCFGVPTVILDRPTGREIAAPDSPGAQSAVGEIVKGHSSIVFAGETWPGHCSPAYMWAAIR